ncbi:MAG TPA: glycosyltransferase family 39 protein, partial [Patescibacteria group bacterium]
MLKKFWQSGAVGIIILISSFLNFWNLPINGWGNGYYAVGARSMGLNLHNFFFNVYDQAGLVTLDKPPAAFWLQAISCKILGWNAWGLFFPQALAGIIAVATVYWLTAKNFGKITGIVAAVMLGVTPIAVAMNRDNNAEAILNLVLIAAAAAGLEGLRRKNNWLILLGFGLIGVGFNVKEAEAMLVLPALAATYFLTANEKFWKRSLILTIGVVLTIIVSMGWIMTVDRIPAERRPFVGSDAKNSEFDLAVYFNGIGRINLGRKMESRPVSAAQGKYQEELLSEIGKPGPLRLFKANLASQTGWLMPMIIFGIIGVIIKWKEWDINQKRTLLLFGGWMAITGLFFSVVGQYNDYYIDLMAIP